MVFTPPTNPFGPEAAAEDARTVAAAERMNGITGPAQKVAFAKAWYASHPPHAPYRTPSGGVICNGDVMCRLINHTWN